MRGDQRAHRLPATGGVSCQKYPTLRILNATLMQNRRIKGAENKVA